MLERKEFWLGACALIGFVYIIGAALVLTVGSHNVFTRLALVMLVVHVLELPLAFKRLAPLKIPRERLVPLTLLFGAAWWLPTQKGIFPANAP